MLLTPNDDFSVKSVRTVFHLLTSSCFKNGTKPLEVWSTTRFNEFISLQVKRPLTDQSQSVALT